MGSVLTENPKGGIAEDFGTIQRRGEALKFSLQIKTWGIAKVIKSKRALLIKSY